MPHSVHTNHVVKILCMTPFFAQMIYGQHLHSGISQRAKMYFDIICHNNYIVRDVCLNEGKMAQMMMIAWLIYFVCLLIVAHVASIRGSYYD